MLLFECEMSPGEACVWPPDVGAVCKAMESLASGALLEETCH